MYIGSFIIASTIIQFYIRQDTFFSITLECAKADFQKKHQILIIQKLFTIQTITLGCQSVDFLFGHIEPIHYTFHPSDECFSIYIHNNNRLKMTFDKITLI